MIAALAAITAAGIVLPHTLRLERVAPVTAVALWLSSLALRAIACLLAVVYALYFLPRTGLFVVLTHWCAHVEVPVSPWELAVEGHGLASFSLFVPGLVLAASLIATCVATVRDVRTARHVVVQHTVGLPEPKRAEHDSFGPVLAAGHLSRVYWREWRNLSPGSGV